MKDPVRPGAMAREENIFNAAVQITDATERGACLDQNCAGDPALRARIEKLLSVAHDPFFNTPVKPDQSSASKIGTADFSFEAPTGRIGRYKLLERIGEGGCGVVYMAEQEEPVRRRVALKVIKLGMDTRSVIARFDAERQALAMMDHPNIARVLDAGATEGGRPFFVMELVRGTRITDYCDQNNLSTRERLALFIQVCHAIQHAHQKGIIHRDIKPSNILVTLHDGVPVPKVIDFGIAKATTDQRLTDKTLFTALEQFIGTPAYMSPEQAEMSGLDIDTRSDIYSLGVLLYELLTGQTPFDSKQLLAAGVDEMRRTICQKPPMRPSTRLSKILAANATKLTSPKSHIADEKPPIDPDLDWIIMKCLEKDRARRYETANGLAKDIERHLRNEPITARPPSHLYQLKKTVHRNKLAFGAAALVTTALILGLAVSLRQMMAARRAQNGEQQQRLHAESAQKTAETERGRANAQAQKASASDQHSRRLLYASDMNSAQQALKLNNLGRARRLLERNRPQPADEDLRGWEWRFLWQLTRPSALLMLTNQPARGGTISFSPDGARLVVGWEGGRVDLWDVPGHRWVRTLSDRESHHRLAQAAFSPVRNLVAVTSGPYEIVLHDLDSGRESLLWQVPDKTSLWDIRDVAFSMDGSKVVIYAGAVERFGDAVWVVDVSSSRIEGRYPAVWSNSGLHGAARLSPDNQRLYLARSDAANNFHSIQCLDLSAGRQLWETKRKKDYGLTALAISPDGKTLASGSGFEDPTIWIWDAATGEFLFRLEEHTGWVSSLAFTRDGRRLISAASDQSIRVWDTTNWTESKVLRGHTDEVYAIAISEPAQLVASVGKDGNLILWEEDGKSPPAGYGRLPENLRMDQVVPLDHSRVLLLPPRKLPEFVDLKLDSPPVSLPGLLSSTNVLGFFLANILCSWNGTNQVLVHKWTGTGFVQQGAVSLDSGTRPKEFTYNPERQLLAWTEATFPGTVHLAPLSNHSTLGPRIQLKSDISSLVLFRFSEDGKYLAGTSEHDHSLRAWNVDTGLPVASFNDRVRAFTFAAGGRVLIAAIERSNDHDISFYDLEHPAQTPRRVSGKGYPTSLALSPDGALVASATSAGHVQMFNALQGELIESVQSHLNGVSAVAFSPDGRRLISTSGGREAVKLWDVGTRQELLTFSGTGSMLEAARWSADGDVLLAGPPWQAWSAPSWAEIEAAEAKGKTAIK